MHTKADVDGIRIRIARPEDGETLLAIYRPYVERTAITFEYDVPSQKEFEARISRTLEKYPYLVAERQDVVYGYAYAGPFVGRAAYDWTAEVSIYLQERVRRMGLGKQLYQALEGLSRAQGLKKLYACIACPETEDEYLTNNSVHFHEHLGYSRVGKFCRCGYKFGQWYHMIWMEKSIGNDQDVPDPVIWFPDLNQETIQSLCRTGVGGEENG